MKLMFTYSARTAYGTGLIFLPFAVAGSCILGGPGLTRFCRAYYHFVHFKLQRSFVILLSLFASAFF